MDTREAKIQLPAYLIGDLSPKEAAILEGHLDVNPEAKAAKEQLARQLLPVINLPAPEAGQAALAKLFMDARRELVKPEYQPQTPWWEGARFFVRVAALVVVTLTIGAIAYVVVPAGSQIAGDLTTATGITRVIRFDEALETQQGVPLTLRLRQSQARVDIDGSAAVVVRREGGHARLDVLRGRAIVGAGSETVVVKCGESTIKVNARSVAAIEYDTPFERLDGAVIELQRQEIRHVARVAEKRFGGLIDDSKLPESVARRRISLYGVGLRQEEFLASFKAATERYGVSFKDDGKGVVLSYKEGTAGAAVDESDSVLKVAPLLGTVDFEGLENKALLDRRNDVLVLEGEMKPEVRHGDEGAMKAQRMVVWAGRTDLPNFKPDLTVVNYIDDSTRSGGKVITVAAALPTGTVLTSNSLRYKGMLVKVGETIELDIGGARKGTLLGVMSSGIEVSADQKGARYFVPVSNTANR
jgi:hypothetical protein